MGLRERIARLEEKSKAAKAALKLARNSLSRNGILSVVTVIISIVAVGVACLTYMKH